MKKTLRILSLLMALMLVLAVFAGCQPTNPNPDGSTTTTTPDVIVEGEVTVYWMQGQKELRKDVIDAGETVSTWTPKVEGKEFVAWYSDPGCSKKFDFTQKITQDTEIFAKFKNAAGGGTEDEGGTVEDATWYLVGAGVGSLSASNWDQTNKVLGMADNGDGTYTITIDFYAGDKFQICTGGTWDQQKGLGCVVGAQLVSGSETEGEVRDSEGNVIFTGSKEYGNPIEKWNITLAPGYDGKYEFTFNEVESSITWKLISKLDPKDPSEGGMGSLDSTYTVAGTGALCGTEWDVADTNNDMTLANGVYTKTFENVPAGTHEFKIAVNHAWSVSYGNEGANVSFTLDAASTVVITFNPNTTAISVTDGNGNVISGEAPMKDPEIHFIGTMNDWTQSYADGELLLTLGADGKTWTGTLTITEEMYGENGYAELKLYDVANNKWYGNVGDANLELAAGTYHFKYVEGNTNFTYWADGESEPTNEPASVVYLVPGSWNGLCAAWCWAGTGAGSWVTLTDEDNDGIYECEVPAGCDMIIFAHFGDAMEADWANKVAQTDDLTVPTNPGVYYHVDTGTWAAN